MSDKLFSGPSFRSASTNSCRASLNSGVLSGHRCGATRCDRSPSRRSRSPCGGGPLCPVPRPAHRWNRKGPPPQRKQAAGQRGASVGNYFVFSLRSPRFCFLNTTNTTTCDESLLQIVEKIQVIRIPISGSGDSMICSRYLGSTTTSDSFLPLKKARMCSFEI